jgi:lipid-binding SYLF domain-containing protein
MDREIQKAVFTLANIDQAIGSAEETESPRDALAGAVGVVFLTVATAGIVFSGRLGSGLVLGRARSGRWSAPSAIMLVGFGGGLQLGVEVADIVIVIDSRDALDALCDSAQLAVATKATATAGSAGRMANRSGLTNKRGPSDQPVSRMRVYSQSRGLFAGVALDTGLLISRPDLNAQFYGSELPVQELLLGRYPAPKGARELYEALDAATASASTSRQSHAASEGIDNDEPNPFAATADDTHGMPSTNASADLPSSSSFGVDNDEQELSV